MANLTPQEIESLKEQLKQKTEELRAIYDKLAEAGVTELPDDCLDAVSGGMRDTQADEQGNAGGSPIPTTFYVEQKVVQGLDTLIMRP